MVIFHYSRPWSVMIFRRKIQILVEIVFADCPYLLASWRSMLRNRHASQFLLVDLTWCDMIKFGISGKSPHLTVVCWKSCFLEVHKLTLAWLYRRTLGRQSHVSRIFVGVGSPNPHYLKPWSPNKTLYLLVKFLYSSCPSPRSFISPSSILLALRTYLPFVRKSNLIARKSHIDSRFNIIIQRATNFLSLSLFHFIRSCLVVSY